MMERILVIETILRKFLRRIGELSGGSLGRTISFFKVHQN